MEGFAEEMGSNLFVFNKSMLSDKSGYPNTQIDDASPENLKRLYHFFEETLEENKAKFETVCNILVRSRDEKQVQSSGLLKTLKKNFFRLKARQVA